MLYFLLLTQKSLAYHPTHRYCSVNTWVGMTQHLVHMHIENVFDDFETITARLHLWKRSIVNDGKITMKLKHFQCTVTWFVTIALTPSDTWRFAVAVLTGL